MLATFDIRPNVDATTVVVEHPSLEIEGEAITYVDSLLSGEKIAA